MQTCNICGQSYPLTPQHWYADKCIKSGFKHTCKTCYCLRKRRQVLVNKRRLFERRMKGI